MILTSFKNTNSKMISSICKTHLQKYMIKNFIEADWDEYYLYADASGYSIDSNKYPERQAISSPISIIKYMNSFYKLDESIYFSLSSDIYNLDLYILFWINKELHKHHAENRILNNKDFIINVFEDYLSKSLRNEVKVIIDRENLKKEDEHKMRINFQFKFAEEN